MVKVFVLQWVNSTKDNSDAEVVIKVYYGVNTQKTIYLYKHLNRNGVPWSPWLWEERQCYGSLLKGLEEEAWIWQRNTCQDLGDALK